MKTLDFVDKFLKAPVSELVSGLSDELKQFFNRRMEAYLAEESNRCLYNKTLLFSGEPKYLLDYYYPLSLRKYSDSLGIEASLSFMRKQLPGQSSADTPFYPEQINSARRRKARKFQLKTVKRLFKESSRVLIIGEAGSGKSTLIKFLFFRAIKENFKIPLRIPLRKLNSYDGDLRGYILEKIFEYHKLAESERIVNRFLNEGRFLLFFDGYDEVYSGIKEKVTADINDFVSRFNKNHYVVSSRPFTEIQLLPLFHNYQVAELDREEIPAFILKQIPEKGEDFKAKIIAAIDKKENRPYESFLKNPMLLSMFILSFQDYPSVPERKSDFYQQVFDTLYSRHNSLEKMAFESEKRSGLNKDQFVTVLKVLSFISLFQETYSFSEFYFDKLVKEIKKRRKKLEFDNEALTYDLLVSVPILTQEGLDYKFPHKSLQEYFCAIHISALSESGKKRVYERISEKMIFTEAKDLMKEKGMSDNFFALLMEVDEMDLNQHLLIPGLKKIGDELLTFGPSKLIDNSKRFLTLLFSSYFFLQRFNLIVKEDKVHKSFRGLIELLSQDKDFMKALASDTGEGSHGVGVFPSELISDHYLSFRTLFIRLLRKQIYLLEQKLIDERNDEEDILSLI